MHRRVENYCGENRVNSFPEELLEVKKVVDLLEWPRAKCHSFTFGLLTNEGVAQGATK